mmetsp:Transcript_25234/g.66140  ORF Transcript_25234/g.66140 Transcript_25234/m.66140 type:complete len:276 (+) Transcript_25234:325-1152(+)
MRSRLSYLNHRLHLLGPAPPLECKWQPQRNVNHWPRSPISQTRNALLLETSSFMAAVSVTSLGSVMRGESARNRRLSSSQTRLRSMRSLSVPFMSSARPLVPPSRGVATTMVPWGGPRVVTPTALLARWPCHGVSPSGGFPAAIATALPSTRWVVCGSGAHTRIRTAILASQRRENTMGWSRAATNLRWCSRDVPRWPVEPTTRSLKHKEVSTPGVPMPLASWGLGVPDVVSLRRRLCCGTALPSVANALGVESRSRTCISSGCAREEQNAVPAT